MGRLNEARSSPIPRSLRSSTIGYCMPPYFVLRFRIDGHPEHNQAPTRRGFSTLTSIKDRPGPGRDDGPANPYRSVTMPAEAIPVVVFFCCAFAVAVGAIAYAQSTAPKDVTRQ